MWSNHSVNLDQPNDGLWWLSWEKLGTTINCEEMKQKSNINKQLNLCVEGTGLWKTRGICSATHVDYYELLDPVTSKE